MRWGVRAKLLPLGCRRCQPLWHSVVNRLPWPALCYRRNLYQRWHSRARFLQNTGRTLVTCVVRAGLLAHLVGPRWVSRLMTKPQTSRHGLLASTFLSEKLGSILEERSCQASLVHLLGTLRDVTTVDGLRNPVVPLHFLARKLKKDHIRRQRIAMAITLIFGGKPGIIEELRHSMLTVREGQCCKTPWSLVNREDWVKSARCAYWWHDGILSPSAFWPDICTAEAHRLTGSDQCAKRFQIAPPLQCYYFRQLTFRMDVQKISLLSLFMTRTKKCQEWPQEIWVRVN